MKVDLFKRGDPPLSPKIEAGEIVRAEVALVAEDERQYKVIILDADDSFDVIIHDPIGERECVWQLLKGPEM